MEYSENQKKAIETCNKNIRIIACAGSGKTSTVSAKVAYLLNPKNKLGILPKNIIAFTYTNKAAAELQNKILSAVEKIPGMADMFIGTIHSWCLSSLKEHVFQFQNYDVLDEIKLKLFVDKYYDDIGMGEISRLDHSDNPLRRYADTSLFTSLMDIIRESDPKNKFPKNIVSAKKRYEKTLLEKHLFDFSMCMDKALECLENNEVLKNQIKDNLKYLIVDEYQDINPIQERIIRKLQEISSCFLVVVGDDDQNIYHWRGSNNKYIIEFDKYYDEKNFVDIHLDINYRSSKGITKLAETFISNNINRIQPKNMFSKEIQKFAKGKDILYNQYESVEEEDNAISDYIAHLIGTSFSEENENDRGIAYSDICILLRTWRRAESLAAVFDEKGIPYVTAGVNQLFNTPEVNAALNIFGFLHGDIDPADLKKSWCSIPHNTIEVTKIEKAIEALKELTPEKFENKKQWDYSLQNIFWEFLEKAEINEESLREDDTPNQKERAEIALFNLGKFSQVINDFEEINYNTNSPAVHLERFLNFIIYAAWDYYPEGWLTNEYKTPNAVQIITVHQAKGLEFPVVIIPGLNRNYFPHKKQGGLKVWHYLDKELILDQDRYNPIDPSEDERRLLYVALTRSQKYILLTRAPVLGNKLYQQESGFFKELNKAKILVENEDFSIFDSLPKLDPLPKGKTKNITLDFTTLKDYFECAYRFKLISMYGFRFPLNPRMGLGQSFHNILMELHKKGKRGDPINLEEIKKRQIYFPHIGSYTDTKDSMTEVISRNLDEYYKDNKDTFKNIIFVEQGIQYKIDEEILVLGRVDLIKREKENGKFETTIIEFKSQEDTQNRKLTSDQLLLYALGHRELTGEKADYIMTYVIGGKEPQAKTPKYINDKDLDGIEKKIKNAADKIRVLNFDKCTNSSICKDCYQNSLCIQRKLLGLKNNRG